MKSLGLKQIGQLFLCFLTTLFIINCSSDNDSGSSNTAKPIIVITGTISPFDATDVLSHSASKSIQVKGTNLKQEIAIEASTNFTISLDDVNFTNEVTIDSESGNAGNTILYVRFSPTESAVGNTIGNLTLKSTQAVDLTIALSGEGVSITPFIGTSQNSLTFDDTVVTNESSALNVIINGDNLVTDINLNVTEGFAISLDNTNYTNALVIPVATANNDTTVYIKFTPSVVGDISGTLTLQNAEAENVEVMVSGLANPVIYNYQTFTDQRIAFGGGFNQTETATFNLHNDLTNIETIKMYVKLRCPSGGCNAWDVFANIKVRDTDSGEWYEIGRYITPYGIDNSALDRGFEIDVTDFKSLLQGSTELYARIETWGADGWELSVDFDYTEGTPDYLYYAIADVITYDDWSTSGVPYGVAIDPVTWDLDKSITIPGNAEATSLRTIISGWGHATPADSDGRACAEWCYRTHNVKINGANTFQHNMGPIGCSSNPVSGQGGNWTPDRAGWCPGMEVPVRVDNFTTTMAGSTFAFEYDYEDWTADGGSTSGTPGAFYATSTFVVVKSNTPIVKPTVN